MGFGRISFFLSLILHSFLALASASLTPPRVFLALQERVADRIDRENRSPMIYALR
jgi:hypothetical protein